MARLGYFFVGFFGSFFVCLLVLVLVTAFLGGAHGS